MLKIIQVALSMSHQLIAGNVSMAQDLLIRDVKVLLTVLYILLRMYVLSVIWAIHYKITFVLILHLVVIRLILKMAHVKNVYRVIQWLVIFVYKIQI